MTATEELRRLLDERGVEHFDGMVMTYTDDADYMPSASNTFDVTLYNLTPAQAIDATLGRGTCHNAMPLLPSGMPYPDSWMCSECGDRMDGIILETGNFCPNCGRKVVDE